MAVYVCLTILKILKNNKDITIISFNWGDCMLFNVITILKPSRVKIRELVIYIINTICT